MSKTLILILSIFGLLSFVVYLATIGLYATRKYKSEHEYSSDPNNKSYKYGSRAIISYVTSLGLSVLLVILLIIASKHWSTYYPYIPGKTVMVVLTSIFVAIAIIGMFIWILTRTIAGPIVINVGATLLSISYLIFGLINLKWYYALIIGLGVMLINLLITFLMTVNRKRNLNDYCLVMLAIFLILSIIIATINLLKTFMFWWIIPTGILAVIIVISFTSQLSNMKNKD